MDDDTRGIPDVGTTHAEWGAGDPRLLVSRGDERIVFALSADLVRIGSAPDAQLLLEGAAPAHATIAHDERDEYVLTLHGEGEMNARPDAVIGEDSGATRDAAETDRSEILRTGARFTVADWTLVFQRDEYADHGRPYGGRQGGEYSDQPTQPPRPDYAAEGHGEAVASDPTHAREG